MADFRAIHFSELYSGSINIDRYDRVSIRTWLESTRDVKGRIAYLPLNDFQYDIRDCIDDNDKSDDLWPKTGKTIWISKESHVPRALLRNSDYKITIDKDKADYIIVPEQTDDEVSVRKADIICIYKCAFTKLYYFTISEGYYNKKLSDNNIDAVKAALKERFAINSETEELEIIYNSEFEQTPAYFVKKCPEIEEILTGNMTKEYVVDTRVRITAPTEMTAEALQIWSKMDDGREMMAKAVIASDWQEHPCTTCVFINSMGLYWAGGEQMKYVKKSVNYEYYDRHGSFPPGLEVQPKDWNTLQDWLMLRAGMGPEGGFKIQRGEGDTKFVRYAECIKPLHITEPMLYQDIEARLKN